MVQKWPWPDRQTKIAPISPRNKRHWVQGYYDEHAMVLDWKRSTGWNQHWQFWQKFHWTCMWYGFSCTYSTFLWTRCHHGWQGRIQCVLKIILKKYPGMKRAWNFKCIKVPRLPIQRFGTWSQLLFAKQLGRWPRSRGNALKQSHQQPTMNLRPNIHRPLMACGIILHICWLNMKHGKKNANCFQFWTHLTTVAIQFASRRHQPSSRALVGISGRFSRSKVWISVFLGAFCMEYLGSPFERTGVSTPLWRVLCYDGCFERKFVFLLSTFFSGGPRCDGFETWRSLELHHHQTLFQF